MAWTQGFPGFFPLGRLLPAAVAAACSAAWTPCLRCHRPQLGDLLDQAVRAARPCSARARSCACNRGAGAVTGRYIPRGRVPLRKGGSLLVPTARAVPAEPTASHCLVIQSGSPASPCGCTCFPAVPMSGDTACASPVPPSDSFLCS